MRVIIIGSGPAGLTMSHALLKAGIEDFVVLERRANPVEISGASLGLWPHTIRIMDQLGLEEGLRNISTSFHESVHLDQGGKVFMQSRLFEHIGEKYARPCALLFELAPTISIFSRSGCRLV